MEIFGVEDCYIIGNVYYFVNYKRIKKYINFLYIRIWCYNIDMYFVYVFLFCFYFMNVSS